MEQIITNTKHPKLTVSNTRFTVKYSNDLDINTKEDFILLANKIKKYFDENQIENTYRGMFKNGEIYLQNNDLTKGILFKL